MNVFRLILILNLIKYESCSYQKHYIPSNFTFAPEIRGDNPKGVSRRGSGERSRSKLSKGVSLAGFSFGRFIGDVIPFQAFTGTSSTFLFFLSKKNIMSFFVTGIF